MAWTNFVLHISTDYDGTSNPTNQGTWTDITSLALWDVDNTTWGNWTPSGDVDLSSYISSNTYIAYEYLGTANSGSTWEIDNILITKVQPHHHHLVLIPFLYMIFNIQLIPVVLLITMVHKYIPEELFLL